MALWGLCCMVARLGCPADRGAKHCVHSRWADNQPMSLAQSVLVENTRIKDFKYDFHVLFKIFSYTLKNIYINLWIIKEIVHHSMNFLIFLSSFIFHWLPPCSVPFPLSAVKFSVFCYPIDCHPCGCMKKVIIHETEIMFYTVLTGKATSAPLWAFRTRKLWWI